MMCLGWGETMRDSATLLRVGVVDRQTPSDACVMRTHAAGLGSDAWVRGVMD